MNGRLLLDTNSAIGIFAQDQRMQECLSKAAEVFLPSIVLGELYYGACKSAHAEANLARIDDFAANSAVLSCDKATARQYGRIKDALRLKGCPIPENDVWIAAIAEQHQLTLISRDDHFKDIEGLAVEKW